MEGQILDNLGYRSEWQEVTVEHYAGYRPNMSHYHMHTYYEVSLILAGEVSVMMSDGIETVTTPRVLLLPPYTMHYILPGDKTEYRRINVLFTEEYITRVVPEWEILLSAFPMGGAILAPSQGKIDALVAASARIEAEENPFRRKLELLLFLSHICELQEGEEEAEPLPDYLADALSYIALNYYERITARGLAEYLGVGRTKLVTGFHRYTGETLTNYVARIRLRAAMSMLRDGASEQEAAEAVGLVSACNFIRVFRRLFGETPKKYKGVL